MLRNGATDTNVIFYLMAAIGVLGVLAKLINHLTLRRLVKAAGNMPKSTHKLIKLVRAKYEHACMIHDSVENIDAFVEKYIYEYRGFLFRIHTWRQIEVLSVWFAGILAALGASVNYLSLGLTETVYQYIAAGIAEMVLLSVIMRLSDEPYKINAVKMYMVDYLENICAIRLRKQTQRERESIDVIAAENGGKGGGQTVSDARSQEEGFRKKARSARVIQTNNASEVQSNVQAAVSSDSGEDQAKSAVQGTREERLPINIEGEPRSAERGEAARQALRSAVENSPDGDRATLGGEAVRQLRDEVIE